ncbi:MAG: efflux transporter, family, subunit [Bacteroidetes bacterium]|jgi:membrane fusion protein (multidrug efflux system)|nr:efflux transporter, family, subunit [Bacteroidota bacterium]
MKKIPNWIIILLVLGALIAVKFLFLNKKDEQAGPAGKGKNAGPVSVNYVIARKMALADRVYTTGRVGAFNEIDITPETAGKVTAIYFKEGENVSAGADILRINDADLQAQLQKSKIQVKLAEQMLERLAKLKTINGVSQEEYDIQENQLNTLKADQSLILAQLAKTTIKAPFSGMIGLKNISLGSYVSPSQVVASLVQVKPLFLEFSLPEKYSALLKKGDKVSFSYQDGKELDATIYAFEPKIDEATKTLRARAKYEGADNFYPGSFVKVFVNIGEGTSSIMIPTQSVIPILKGEKVFVAKDGVAKEVKVITGIRTEDMIQVTEGIQEGDTVLTTGLLAVKKESKLKLIKANK